METTAPTMLTPAQKGAASRKANEAARAERAAARWEAAKAGMAAKAATWFACPDCDAFPFETESDLAEHLASGDHDSAPVAARCAAEGESIDAPERGEGTGGGTAAPVNLATEKQIAYLASLLARLATEAGGDVFTPDSFAKGLASLTKAAASDAIERAKEALEATPAPANVRPNKYSAKCAGCGVTVAEGAGSLTKEAGKWITRHVGACPIVEAAAPAGEDAPEGFHRFEGSIYSVKLAVHGSGLPVARRLLVENIGEGSDRLGWDYIGRKGVFHKLSAATLLTKEEAQELGRLYGYCCCCSKVLTDDVSIERGMGPVCFGKSTGFGDPHA